MCLIVYKRLSKIRKSSCVEKNCAKLVIFSHFSFNSIEGFSHKDEF